jgi:hypothetical protein
MLLVVGLLKVCRESVKEPLGKKKEKIDTTVSLDGGKSSVGWSREYADNWERVFCKKPPQETIH